METANITQLLRQWQDGDKQAEEQLILVAMDELRRLVRGVKNRRAGDSPLQTTECFNELYLRLQSQNHQIQWDDRKQFFKFCSRMMRQILVDDFRKRDAQKRGGGEAEVPFDDEMTLRHDGQIYPMDELDDALERLEKHDEVMVEVVHLRFFGGYSVEEVAEIMEISTPTVKRNFRKAKAWLNEYMVGGD